MFPVKTLVFFWNIDNIMTIWILQQTLVFNVLHNFSDTNILIIFIQKIFILELNIYFALVMAKWLLNLFFLSTPIHTMVINLSKYSLLFFSLASKLHDYCKQNKTQNFLTRFLRLCFGSSLLSNFSQFGSIRWLLLMEKKQTLKMPKYRRYTWFSIWHRFIMPQLLFYTKACAQYLYQRCSSLCLNTHLKRFCWAKIVHVWLEVSLLRTCEQAGLAWIPNSNQVHDLLQGGVVIAAAPLKDYQSRGDIFVTINSIIIFIIMCLCVHMHICRCAYDTKCVQARKQLSFFF